MYGNRQEHCPYYKIAFLKAKMLSHEMWSDRPSEAF